MFASARIAGRALRAVARRDAARDRLLHVFLLPWGIGTIALLVGSSWIPPWLWDAVGLGRHGLSSPQEILRTWALIGLLPLVWLGVRRNLLHEGARGAWGPLLRLPLSARALLLAKALRGLTLPLVTGGIGLLLAVTASPFGEIDEPQTLAAAAGLASFLACTYALLFTSALLGRHRLLLWAALAGALAWFGAGAGLPGAELFWLGLEPELSARGLRSALGALALLSGACLAAGAGQGSFLLRSAGPLRSQDLSRAALAALLALAPWALQPPRRAPVELAGQSLHAAAPARLEVELDPAARERSEALLELLARDLSWLRELGLEPAPLALAFAPAAEPGTLRRRELPDLWGVLLDANLPPGDVSDARLRERALRELLAEHRPWARGRARLLAAGLPRQRTGAPGPDQDLLAAWVLRRLESERGASADRAALDWDALDWDALEARVGRGAAANLAAFTLADLERRAPGAVEAWARAAASDPSVRPAPALFDPAALRALGAAQEEALAALPSLSELSLEAAPGGLRYRARLSSPPGASSPGAPRLVLLATQRGATFRGEALLGAPGFDAESPQGWAQLSLPRGRLRWQLGLRLPSLECDLIFASGEAEAP